MPSFRCVMLSTARSVLSLSHISQAVLLSPVPIGCGQVRDFLNGRVA